MGPEQLLPLPKEFTDADSYVESLLTFGTSSELLQTLCGGVHILDFFTRTPDLYSLVLPEEWREWFENTEIMDILDLLLREDLSKFGDSTDIKNSGSKFGGTSEWRLGPCPPRSLIQYIRDVRKHLLNRDFNAITSTAGAKHTMNHLVAMGMSAKKVHEVDHFARYVDKLTADIANISGNHEITHIVDFGSGQNYLGRALASEPYNNNIIAVESRPHVVEGARKADQRAGIGEKVRVKVNKKAFRAGLESPNETVRGDVNTAPSDRFGPLPNGEKETVRAKLGMPKAGRGTVQYVQHRITDGDLNAVIEQIASPSSTFQSGDCSATNLPSKAPALMVISLHSCGNLLHHGLRTLVLNPSVKAVAMIGCCYNLLTERLGTPSYKLPSLRAKNQRLETTSTANDPHGFPMSERFANYRHRVVRPYRYLKNHKKDTKNGHSLVDEPEMQVQWETGIRINITARMMAVQAPLNWKKEDYDAFFTRHFYRAVLQRIFLDNGIVSAPEDQDEKGDGEGFTVGGGGISPAGTGPSQGTPVVIGTLGKKCYASFLAYVRGAVAKLVAAPHYVGDPIIPLISERIGGMADDEILEYEKAFLPRKKELEVVWSLMAFSASVIEAMIVVDRWLWLREQDCVNKAWVQSVFEYGQSPRNLVVVGIKS